MKLIFVPSRTLFSSRILRNRLTEDTEKFSKGRRKTTIDISEVQHHSKLRSKWWDVDGELKALHAFNPIRVQFVRDGLANMGFVQEPPTLPLDGLRVVDVGCGGGLLSEPLARIGARVTGIDASSELIETAREHASLDRSLAGRLDYSHVSVEEFAEKNAESFDAVVASEVLEHVNDKEFFLKCCADLAKPRGSLFITTLNRTFPSWLGGIIMAEQVLRLVPAGTHDWKKFISPEEVAQLLQKLGCKTKLLHGMIYNPLTNQWQWTTTTAINYALHAVKTESEDSVL